ncbi:BtrH N-terminal domain-containing protein [Gilvimarinus sp. SDUM040013]|uniref:BtrH N-terminal domain-containing protein n=1 Tax=Gilvimarinus gilvus TaxID=3058038 RepID=A0ABU4S1T9_9GAMM|nr:BtrH N-terminal domain-containing protein [Gilvimarinus sp. SDUM040013]MDO3387810.1 BtrH N-terminal domain-containing protein [Gilvimarinus sp. SDUM040013]MDX6851047.1 BtrH N-terminal domain-containing protein [Gilvimarinus sp. SDUM040013]
MTFSHSQSAHCESGVISSLLTHHGLPISEPMAFGLANALAFAYIPIVKLGGQPLIAYRLPPRAIIKGLCKRLGVEVKFHKFKDPMTAANALDDLVEKNVLVGLQTSVYYLPYFPEEMRFHFNAHNLLVYGKRETVYQISDPVFEEPMEIAPRDLNKARFVRGPLAPKGLMYTIDSVPERIDYPKVISAAIAKNVKVMTGAPLPVIGIRGIHYLAKKIDKLNGSEKDKRLYLGHIVRMQEEIGTGGAGFRFVYASFLQESAKLLGDESLTDASKAMTNVGDTWREFALIVVKECKSKEPINLKRISDKLRACAEQEKQVWLQLKSWCKQST